MPQKDSASFADKLLAWFDVYGRKNLPWQNPINHYRVWISEIMLQQTQVATVIDYFNRFMEKFPSLEALAKAPLDEVMNAWAGLGYYTRARNLHKTAQIIMSEHGGTFPADLAAVMNLPGIGRSTASAILSIVNQQPLAILDGNVKRVLTRYFEISGWYGDPKVEKQLWAVAQPLVPASRAHHYTQAIMDLGATLCTAKNPDCASCPLQAECGAYAHQTTHVFPTKKPSKKIPERSAEFAIIIVDRTHILLNKQLQKGVWNELWVPPNTLFENELWGALVENSLIKRYQPQKLRAFAHVFSHFKLKMNPSLFQITAFPELLDFPVRAVKLSELHEYGLPAPIQKLLDELLDKERDLLSTQSILSFG